MQCWLLALQSSDTNVPPFASCRSSLVELQPSKFLSAATLLQQLDLPPFQCCRSLGYLERQTKILSRAVTERPPCSPKKSGQLYESHVWSLEISAEELLDEIDDFALVASKAVRSQVVRSESNSLKSIVPFCAPESFWTSLT